MSRFLGELPTDVYGENADFAKVAHITLSTAEAATADADGVHAAITGSSAAATTVTTDITDPPYPRNLTVVSAGTAGDIAAGDVVVSGTNWKNEAISETFTFTADTDETLTGDYAFKTVTSILVHQQDGAAATFAVGFGDKIGVPYAMSKKTLVMALHDGTIETTAATQVVDADDIEKNTVDLDTALDGSVVDLYFVL